MGNTLLEMQDNDAVKAIKFISNFKETEQP
jgi:hypothetical protein